MEKIYRVTGYELKEHLAFRSIYRAEAEQLVSAKNGKEARIKSGLLEAQAQRIILAK